jgi:hypothetical protein
MWIGGLVDLWIGKKKKNWGLVDLWIGKYVCWYISIFVTYMLNDIMSLSHERVS